MLKVKAQLAVLRDINGYSTAALQSKEFFHTEGKRFLRDVAKELGLAPGTFDIRSNKGGMAVSGEVTLHADTIYVQLSESCMGPGVQAMYRACKGRGDYTGGMNNFANLRDVFADPADFIRKLKRVGGL